MPVKSAAMSWWKITACPGSLALIYETALILRRPPPYPEPNRFKRTVRTWLWRGSLIFWAGMFLLAMFCEPGGAK